MTHGIDLGKHDVIASDMHGQYHEKIPILVSFVETGMAFRFNSWFFDNIRHPYGHDELRHCCSRQLISEVCLHFSDTF